MKTISKKSNTKRNIIIAFVCALLLVASAAVYILAFKGTFFGWPNRSQTDSSIDYNKPTPEQVEAGNNVKNENVNNSKPSSENGTDHPEDSTPSTNGGKATTGITITAANQNASTLQIRSLISTVTNAGTCTLKLTGATEITKTASVQPSANTSTCMGFDVPMSELSPGEWLLTLNFTNDTLTADTSQKITIK